MYLKIYDTEQVHATPTGNDEESFRKWSKEYVQLLADTSPVHLNSEFLIFLTNSEQILCDYRNLGSDLYGCSRKF